MEDVIVPIVQGHQDLKGSLIKMIITDWRQRKKGDYKAPRSEKCLGV